MGNTWGRLVLRPLRNYNVENRAHKIISKNKPAPAPQFTATEKQKAITKQIYPDYEETVQKKDEALDSYLKKVYVNADENVQEIDTRHDPNKPLPRDRFIPDEFEFGFYEPEEVEAGKLTLRQAVDLLTKYKTDPNVHTKEQLAEQFKLDVNTVADILEYFTIYKVIKNEDKNYQPQAIPISCYKSSLKVLVGPPKKKDRKPWVELDDWNK